MPSRERVNESWELINRLFPMVRTNPFWRTLPSDTVEHLLCYLAFGDPMGGFCQALVAGDLFRACCNADSWNENTICCAAKWIQQSWPPRSFGSYDKTTAWRVRKEEGECS